MRRTRTAALLDFLCWLGVLVALLSWFALDRLAARWHDVWRRAGGRVVADRPAGEAAENDGSEWALPV